VGWCIFSRIYTPEQHRRFYQKFCSMMAVSWYSLPNCGAAPSIKRET
jgi:hypothetical protein